MSLRLVERSLQSHKLIEKRLGNRPIEFDGNVPRDSATEVDNFLCVVHDLLRREAWCASAPGLPEVTEHVDLRAINLAVNRSSNGDHLWLVDLAGGKVFVGRDRDDAIHHSRIEGDDRIGVAGAPKPRRINL